MTAMIALLIGAGITIIVLIIAKKIALTEHEIDEKEIRKIIEKIWFFAKTLWRKNPS